MPEPSASETSAVRWAFANTRKRLSTFGVSVVLFGAISGEAASSGASWPLALGIGTVGAILVTFVLALALALRQERDALRAQLSMLLGAVDKYGLIWQGFEVEVRRNTPANPGELATACGVKILHLNRSAAVIEYRMESLVQVVNNHRVDFEADGRYFPVYPERSDVFQKYDLVEISPPSVNFTIHLDYAVVFHVVGGSREFRLHKVVNIEAFPKFGDPEDREYGVRVIPLHELVEAV